MPDGFSGLMGGAKAVSAEITAMQARVEAASVAAVKQVQNTAKSSVKAGMRGRPRYDRRGPIGNGGPAVNLNLTPHIIKKGGGPGSLTGNLRKSVGAVKKPEIRPDGVHGGVGVGGSRSLAQIYRREVEAEYPFLAPGIAKATPKFPAIWNAAWAKATSTTK